MASFAKHATAATTSRAQKTASLASRGPDAGERECCLLVLRLVSSTLPCIRQPRPRLRVLDICGFVLVCTQAFMGFFKPMSAWLISPPSSGTLAFSLRLAPSLPAADFPVFARVTRLPHLWLTPHSLGPPPPSLLLAASSDTLASSLRLMPTTPATNALSLHSGSSAPSPTTPPSRGPIFSNCPPRPDLYYVHLQ